MTNESQTMQLSEFGPSDWFSDRTKSSFWLRIYTSLMLPHDKFISTLDGPVMKVSLEEPVALGYAVMEGLKAPQVLSYMYAGVDGMTVLEFSMDQKTLKKSNYVFISTPMRVDGKNGNESDAKRRLDIVAGVIQVHVGTNFMRDIVFDAEVEAGTDQYHQPSSAVRIPKMAEGPFLNKTNWEHIEQLINNVQRLQPEVRARVKLALEFFSKALHEGNSFFNYWTALEILCNGTAQTIREKLKRCYSLKNLTEVDDATGFGQIARWRHSFFHKGIRPNLSADTERYIQLLFLDLLRQEIHLPLAGHLAAIQQAQGYNLSELGLPDNRTEEQKTAERKARESLQNPSREVHHELKATDT